MSDAMNPVVLSCRGLQKTYRQGVRGNAEVPVLLGVDLQVKAGERVAVISFSSMIKQVELLESALGIQIRTRHHRSRIIATFM